MTLKRTICLRVSVLGFALLCAVLLLFPNCSRGAKSDLIIGMELNYPPFEMVDPGGQPSGISVEMARALGKYLGREIRIENMPFDGLIPALKTSKIDLIISSMTATPERAHSIDFSDPYLRTGICLLINKAAPIESIADTDKSKIGRAHV